MGIDFSRQNQGEELQKWRISFVGKPNDLKSLQFAVNSVGPAEELDIFLSNLDQLKNQISEVDLYLVLVDMGQPVPRHKLEELSDKHGLCAMVQPTPNQLLSVSDLPGWRSFNWHHGDFQMLAQELFKSLKLGKLSIRREVLVNSLERWLLKKIKEPSRLVFVNPPSGFISRTDVSLENQSGMVTIGCSKSESDICLPVSGKHELFQLFNSMGKWRLRVTGGAAFKVETSGKEDGLVAGDSLAVAGFELQLRPNKSVEEILGVIYQSGFGGEIERAKSGTAPAKVLDLFKDLMLSALTGELKIVGPKKKASIFIEGGRLQAVFCGSVYGIKALTRIFSWPQFSWTFTGDRKYTLKVPAMRLSYFSIHKIFKDWEISWKRFGPYMPPADVKLELRPDLFRNRQNWTLQDFHVAASVCEFDNFLDMLNNCHLMDVEILDSLIRMRKEGVLALGS